MEKIVEITVLGVLAVMVGFLLFSLVTDFKATLLVVLVILVGRYIISHFWRK